MKMEKKPSIKNENENEKYTDSLLIELGKNQHIAGIYNVVICFALGFLIQEISKDYFEHQDVYLGWKFAKYWIEGLDFILLVWTIVFILYCSMFKWIQIWSNLRKSKESPKNLDRLGWSLVVFYYVGTLILMPCLTKTYPTSFALTFTLCLEQMRLLVKFYSFLRVNTWKVFEKDENLPSFKHFLYFTFAPTVMYKDEFVKRKKPIRWDFVLKRVLELSLSTILAVYVHKSIFTSKSFQNFYEKDNFNLGDIANFWLENLLLYHMCAWLFFFCYLNCVQNIFGEIMKFDNRNFYSDWWAAESGNTWWGKWNAIISTWVQVYVYQDSSKFLPIIAKSKLLKSLLCFFISSLAHEWIVSLSLGCCTGSQFFYVFVAPVLLSMYHPRKNQLTSFIYCFIVLIVAPPMVMTLLIEYCFRSKTNMLNAPYFENVSWKYFNFN